jgi:hypothetical protein
VPDYVSATNVWFGILPPIGIVLSLFQGLFHDLTVPITRIQPTQNTITRKLAQRGTK